MKSRNAIGSKMLMPSFPHNLIVTKRVAGIHHNMRMAQTISVNAPAGYGKTALALSYLHTLPAGKRVLWYNLEPEDNNPELILHSLLEALLYPEAVSGEEKEANKKALEAADYRELIELACRSLWKRDDPARSDQVHLVFDNCQHLDYESNTAILLRQLIDNAPLLLKTYFLSRKPYTLVDEKYKLEKRHLQINSSDLLFSKQELETIIETMDYGSITTDQISELCQITEGWIAAALILLQALKRQAVDNFQKFHPLEDNLALNRYLTVEVLDSIEKPDIENFCKFSLLSEFSKDSVVSLFEIENLEMELGKYPELSLFIFRTGGDPLEYRFHKLIRHYLEKKASSHFSREQLAELHYRIADFCVEQGHYNRAVDHIKKCTDFEKTVQLVTSVGIRFMLVGERGQLKNWLTILPHGLVNHNPVLLIFKALLLPQNEFGEAEKLLVKAFQYSLAQKNSLILYRAATSLVFIHFCKNNMRGIATTTRKAGKEMISLKDDSAGRINLLAIMNNIGKDSFVEGLRLADSQDTSDLLEEDYWLYLAYSTVINLYLGKLDQAGKLIAKALSLDCVERTEPAKGTALYLHSIISVLKNDPNIMSAQLSALSRISEKYGFSFFQAGVKYLSAYADYMGFEFENAYLKLDDAAFTYQAFGNQAMTILVKMLKRLWARQVDSSETTWEQVAWEVETINRLKPGLMLEEITFSIQGAIARETGRYKAAEQHLLKAINKAKRKKAAQVLCGSYFHLAKLYYDTDKRQDGRVCLRKAMAMAEEGRFFMFWDIHLPTTVELALRAIKEGIAAEYAGELLSRLFNASAAAFLSFKSVGLDDQLLPVFTAAFLAEFEKKPSKKFYYIKATLFGNAAIQINGSKIPEAAWKTKKNRGLLEYLILCSGRPVAKEKIIDLLWPDSDSYSAQTSLRTALYQLRKILSARAVETAGKEALIVETPETLMIESSETLESDLGVYKKIAQDLLVANKVAEPATPAEQESLEELVMLYRGELLANRDYGDILQVEREKCRTIFEEACFRLSELYVGQGKLGHAESILERSLIVDPYSERSCLALANIYTKQGKRTKALKLLKDFKKRLHEELGLDPDTSIIEALQNP